MAWQQVYLLPSCPAGRGAGTRGERGIWSLEGREITSALSSPPSPPCMHTHTHTTAGKIGQVQCADGPQRGAVRQSRAAQLFLDGTKKKKGSAAQQQQPPSVPGTFSHGKSGTINATVPHQALSLSLTLSHFLSLADWLPGHLSLLGRLKAHHFE